MDARVGSTSFGEHKVELGVFWSILNLLQVVVHALLLRLLSVLLISSLFIVVDSVPMHELRLAHYNLPSLCNGAVRRHTVHLLLIPEVEDPIRFFLEMEIISLKIGKSCAVLLLAAQS